MDGVKLYKGDCLQVMQELIDKGVKVDMVLTDIPYGEVNRNTNGLRNLDKKNADFVNFNIECLIKTLYEICNGSFYIFCGIEQVSEIRSTMKIKGLSTRLCIWEKTNPSPMNGQHIWLSGIECCVYGKKKNATFNEHCKNSVFRFPTERGKLHPTMKPVRLMEYLVKSSSKENDTILDCFMGSGSTGVACVNTSRKFIGIELDDKYFEIAENRIKEAVNNKQSNLF